MIFLQAFGPFDFASKIQGVFPLLAFGIAALFLLRSFFENSSISKTKLVLMCGGIFLLGLFGLLAHIYSSKQTDEDYSKIKKAYASLQGQKEKLTAENSTLLSIKDSCTVNKLQFEIKIDSLTAQKQRINENYLEAVKDIKHLQSELKKYKAFKYDFCEGFAVVRNDEGLAGFLRKGFPESTVDFIYKDACKFSSGRAGVKYKSDKWGFVDKSLGKPVIPCIFEDAHTFQKSKARVLLDGYWIWIDKSGRKISEAPEPKKPD